MWIMIVPVILCMSAVFYDLREREIPDSIPLCLLVTGLVATGLSWSPISWTDALLGVALAFVITVPFTLSDGIGGGDLKLVSGLGAWLGPALVLSLLFWTAIAGVVSAIIAHNRKQKDFAYAPAIAAGLIITVIFPTGVASLLDFIRPVLRIV
ncbi:Type IV leader peptidase family protein [Thalassoglobus neptunius]|uniref:Type IV leader peptidase family protein n=1 Tax=Thalassoglobus neptunius TaxID=1938619 RepID=A0A5C5XAH6_9PLAN|nr:A24 family peptidase [Thalassoglobus neptunius]TWT58862.1 Type IV leader peptidase family protein [Thalassoglobus neptunius]